MSENDFKKTYSGFYQVCVMGNTNSVILILVLLAITLLLKSEKLVK